MSYVDSSPPISAPPNRTADFFFSGTELGGTKRVGGGERGQKNEKGDKLMENCHDVGLSHSLVSPTRRHTNTPRDFAGLQ